MRRAYKISNEKKKAFYQHINKLPSLWANVIERSIAIDGLKLFLTDKTSVLIRSSGTEAKVKFYLEADSEDQNEKLLNLIKEELNLTGEGVEC